nr:DUF4326 domain-containing protein [Caldimonas sp.]
MNAATHARARATGAAGKAVPMAKAGATGKAATPGAALPQRVQLKRSAGWKMPANTVKVDRTTRWGNPFTIAECGSAAIAVAQHGRWMRGEIGAPGGVEPPTRDALRSALAGRNLACWCALNGPCHADLLLALANKR